jgi:tRNA nucleotidyltransferase (CCA-adding enzyme)
VSADPPVLARLREAPGADVVLAAVEGEPHVHAVGGAVRDALLGRRPRELDLLVEGDAGVLARRAALRIGGVVTAHDRFGTATVMHDGVVFDLATARRERYARPGALPDVELGATVAEDLGRRDFSVNAIAVRLADGALTEWPGARADLGASVLRVLHDRSFADDPTRLLRLARYAARLGFAAEPATERLAAAAVAGGAVASVSGERLGTELRLLLGEPQPAALLELERHGLGAAVLGPELRVPRELVEAAQAACPPDARADLVALAACCTGFEPAALAARLDALGFPRRERETLVRAAALARVASETALWRRLRREPVEAAVLLAAMGGPAGEAARRWLEEGRRLRLAITGHDLVAAGLSGPAVGAALEAATEAMLAGSAPDRESQLAAALGTRRS